MKSLLFLLFVFNVSAQEVSELSTSILKQPKVKLLQEEKEQNLMDYSNIKSVLKKDGLKKFKDKKSKNVEQIKKVKSEIELAKYNYPASDDFWSFMSEYWLVKNAQALQWDFSKPKYGIAKAFRSLLEQIGYYNRKIKILIVNTPNITHTALPGNKDEYFFIISLPFMRTLDLTKVDIALLFLEDMYRIDQGFFKSNIKKDISFIGTNFQKSKLKKQKIDDISAEYTRILFKDGFSFQQQYAITKQMDAVLRSDPTLRAVYLKLLGKIDELVKDNLLYKDYTKIYPSPELQIKWLSPEKKIL
jgi:hypothetical protein